EGDKALVPNILESQDRFVNTLGLTEYELYTLVREDGRWKVDSQILVEPAEQAKWFPKAKDKSDEQPGATPTQPKPEAPKHTETHGHSKERFVTARSRVVQPRPPGRELHAPYVDPGGDRVGARDGVPSRGRNDPADRADDLSYGSLLRRAGGLEGPRGRRRLRRGGGWKTRAGATPVRKLLTRRTSPAPESR